MRVLKKTSLVITSALARNCEKVANASSICRAVLAGSTCSSSPSVRAAAFKVARQRLGDGIGGGDEKAERGRAWDQLAREFQSLRTHLDVQLGRAGDVAAGPAQAPDQAEVDPGAGRGEDGPDRPGRPLCPASPQR